MTVYKASAIGNRAFSHMIPYTDITALASAGLEPPLYNHEAWGPEMDAWFESEATGISGFSNAGAWIAGAFKYEDDV